MLNQNKSKFDNQEIMLFFGNDWNETCWLDLIIWRVSHINVRRTCISADCWLEYKFSDSFNWVWGPSTIQRFSKHTQITLRGICSSRLDQIHSSYLIYISSALWLAWTTQLTLSTGYNNNKEQQLVSYLGSSSSDVSEQIKASSRIKYKKIKNVNVNVNVNVPRVVPCLVCLVRALSLPKTEFLSLSSCSSLGLDFGCTDYYTEQKKK